VTAVAKALLRPKYEGTEMPKFISSSSVSGMSFDSPWFYFAMPTVLVTPIHRSETMKKTITAIAAASVLLLSACGSDGSSTDTTVAAADTTEMPAEVGTIVEVAQGNADFSTLVAAVVAADLAETLSGEGPFTVFAPTNAAFEALPAGLLEKLLLPENKDTLVKILTYHVVPSKVMAADVMAGDVTTVEGSTFTIATEGGVKVNTSNVTATDVPASNGVIHVIDAVLVPSSVDVSAL
jgi:uncharacterized surface protein with fasciclin (FAS1) repeats